MYSKWDTIAKAKGTTETNTCEIVDTQKMVWSLKQALLASALLVLVSPGLSEYEVPTKKALPPKMDPIP